MTEVVSEVVTVTGVRRRYREVEAVSGASLGLAAGEVVGVAGPSGEGKSTLLRLVAGIERPDEGEVSYGGAPAWPARRARRATYPRPAYVMPVFQDPYASLDPRWPVWRSITEPLTVRGVPAEQRRAEAVALLERADLASVRPDARPHQLSGGQNQRVAILRALAARPALLVADEPTARQDVLTAARIGDLLLGAAADGVAVLVVSHDRRWLERFAGRVLGMGGGHLT